MNSYQLLKPCTTLLAAMIVVGQVQAQELPVYSSTDDAKPASSVTETPITIEPVVADLSPPAEASSSSRRLVKRAAGNTSCDCDEGGDCGCHVPPSCGCEEDCGCDTGCDSGCGCGGGKSCYWFGCGRPIELHKGSCWGKLGGWVEFGYTNGNVPLSVNRADVLSFRDVQDNFLLNQGYVFLEKAPDVGLGYRIDAMYGTDASKTFAFGNPAEAAGGNPRGWDNNFTKGIYGLAIPQAYLSMGAGDLSIIAGHFYTPVGYEVITAPDNFFYSHSLTSFNSEPFTHTGVLSTLSVGDSELYAGWTLGWDTGFDQFGNAGSWLGGFSLQLTNRTSLTYITTGGNLGLRGNQAYTHSVVIDTDLGSGLEWVVQSDFVNIGAANPNGVPFGVGMDQVGVNSYLFYKHNDVWKWGARMEWWKSDGISYYEVTGGVNIKPHANVVIRPELRHDFTPTTVGGVAGGAPNPPLYFGGSVTTFGVDVILTF